MNSLFRRKAEIRKNLSHDERWLIYNDQLLLAQLTGVSLMTENDRPQGREKRDRKATEAAIVEAFEAVLLRDGVQGLGVNAVAQEAGVNKVLIYRYFQDFPGLARFWATNSSFWPSELELIGDNPDAFEKLEVRERVVKVLGNYIDGIRSRPRTVEAMAGELVSPNETTKALADGMVRPGKGVGDYIKIDTADKDIGDRVWKMIFLTSAMTSFFAVRERNNPQFLGFDLSQDDSWEFIRETIQEIARAYIKD
jgi:AcrR family transcriptional regulator